MIFATHYLIWPLNFSNQVQQPIDIRMIFLRSKISYFSSENNTSATIFLFIQCFHICIEFFIKEIQTANKPPNSKKFLQLQIYLFSLPFHCLNECFFITSSSSVYQISLDKGGRMYGIYFSALMTKT